MHEMIGRFDVLSTSAAPSLRGGSRLWTKPFLNVNPFRYRVAPEGCQLARENPPMFASEIPPSPDREGKGWKRRLARSA